MPKPNYAYEKRQRELAKKNKKAEKAKEKADRKTHPVTGEELPGGDDAAAPEEGAEQQGAEGAPPATGSAAG